MQALGHRLARHYTAPFPEADEPSECPFPRTIVRSTWAGVGLGALFGLLIHFLLYGSVLAIPGAEALYAMAPYTFAAFWMATGSAFGLAVGGIGAILLFRTRPGQQGAGETSR